MGKKLVNITPALEALTGLSKVTDQAGIDKVIADLEVLDAQIQVDKGTTKKQHPSTSQQIEDYLRQNPVFSDRQFYEIVKILGYQSRRIVQSISSDLALFSSEQTKNNNGQLQSIKKEFSELERNISSLIEATKHFNPWNDKVTRMPKILKKEN